MAKFNLREFSYWVPNLFVDKDATPQKIPAWVARGWRGVLIIRGYRPVYAVPSIWLDDCGNLVCHQDSLTARKFFNTLCDVVLYGYYDLRCTKRVISSCRSLMNLGYSHKDVARYSDPIAECDLGLAMQVYTQLVISYGLHRLGAGWVAEHDYWGAKCLCYGNRPTGDQRGNHVLAGDSSGMIKLFYCYDAMTQYMDRIVATFDEQKAFRFA